MRQFYFRVFRVFRGLVKTDWSNKMKKLFALVLLIPLFVFGQQRLPLEIQTPPIGTSHADMLQFLNSIAVDSRIFDLEISGNSAKGRELPALFFPKKNDWKNDDITVMVFAQQHGNEPSGKEALLMLIHELYLNRQKYDLNNLNLILIPMVNPDGNEVHRRRNGNNYDLNRNHVILSEPEVQMLHRIFNKYNPEITLDVHEYGFSSWLDLGYIKNFGEQLDCISNPAIPGHLKDFALTEILTPTISASRERNVRANRYLITGGNLDYFVRHSTTDIDDGRNGFGICNTLSFILEGFNPLVKEEQIWQRAKHQLTLIESFLTICNQKSGQINQLVHTVRNKAKIEFPDSVAIHADYTAKSSHPLKVILKKTSNFKDTTIALPDYRSEPEVLLKVRRPDGYLVEKPSEQLLALIKNHQFNFYFLSSNKKMKAEEFSITGKDTLHFESRDTIIPAGTFLTIEKTFPKGSMVIPTANDRAAQIVQIFEPRSFYGISYYDEFSYLVNQKIYHVYRVYFSSNN